MYNIYITCIPDNCLRLNPEVVKSAIRQIYKFYNFSPNNKKTKRLLRGGKTSL